MAIVNILAKSNSLVEWVDLLNDFDGLDLSYVEIFPIPKELGFDSDALGINVQRRNLDREIALTELKKVFDYCESRNFALTELYDGMELKKENFEGIIRKFLS